MSFDAEPPFDSEIREALEEYEAQSSGKQKVSTQLAHISPMALFLIRNSGGAISNEKQANFVLCLFALVAIACSVFLFSRIPKKSEYTLPPIYKEDVTPLNRETIPPNVLNKLPYKNAR